MANISCVLEAVEITRQAFSENSDSHWIVGYSGGKDSTALLKILLSAANKADSLPRIDIVYCDTGVENPLLDAYVKSVFRGLEIELSELGLPIRPRILQAPVANRFFVKIIGRGYPRRQIAFGGARRTFVFVPSLTLFVPI